MPFKDEYLMFRVFAKWFAVIPLKDLELNICLKCDPSKAIELREQYNCVEAAWHFNKKYWNNITLNRDMDDETLKYWISHSIEEVVKNFPRKYNWSIGRANNLLLKQSILGRIFNFGTHYRNNRWCFKFISVYCQPIGF